MVANEFIIGEMDFEDSDNFMFSDNIKDIAVKHKFWDPVRAASLLRSAELVCLPLQASGAPFNFRKAYTEPSFHRHRSDIHCSMPLLTLSLGREQSQRVCGPPQLARAGDGCAVAASELELDAQRPGVLGQARSPADPQGHLHHAGTRTRTLACSACRLVLIVTPQRDHYEGTEFDLTTGLAGQFSLFRFGVLIAELVQTQLVRLATRTATMPAGLAESLSTCSLRQAPSTLFSSLAHACVGQL